jgi:NADH dehydrogenase
MQQGRYVARRISDRLEGRPTAPFRYHDRGSMAVIGRTRAVAQMKGLRFGGYLAWLAWLFVHLIYLVGFGSRMLVLAQWAWSYFTFGRTARLITGPSPLPLVNREAALRVPVLAPVARTVADEASQARAAPGR